MTGTRLSLRRYSGCNLHWYGPKSYDPRASSDLSHAFPGAPFRRARYRLYHADEAPDGSWLPTEEFTWIGTDCGWEWLATRPGVRFIRPLHALFRALHDHVHTPHRKDRIYVFLPVKRAMVRLLGAARLRDVSRRLDTAWETDVYPDSHRYRIKVTFPRLNITQTMHLAGQLPMIPFEILPHEYRPDRTRASWVESASNPTLAFSRAQTRARNANLLGGSAWDRVTEEEGEKT